MGKMLECGGSKTFQNLEQCHEIEGEFKKIPFYYINPPFSLVDTSLNNKQNYIDKQKIDDKESELNIIIYNNDEFCCNTMNNKDIKLIDLDKNKKENSNHKIINNVIFERNKLNKPYDKNHKKIKSRSFGELDINLMNKKSIKKNRDSNIRLNKKDKMNSEFNSKEGKTLIYNNSEKIIKRKLNDNKNIKNNINDIKNIDDKFKTNENKNNTKPNLTTNINNFFKDKKYKKINYAELTNFNPDKLIYDSLKRKEKLKALKKGEKENKITEKCKKEKFRTKRNESHRTMSTFLKSENMTNSKIIESLRGNKKNYNFRPKIKPRLVLYRGDINTFDSYRKVQNRKTNLTSGSNSPKFSGDVSLERNKEKTLNYKNSSNYILNRKYNMNKFFPRNNSDDYIKPLGQLQLNDTDLNFVCKHYSNNIINKYKINHTENEILNNNDIIKLKIPFKGTQINHNLLNSSVKGIFTLNFNMLSNFSDKAILFDGNIYKVTKEENGISRLIFRYFQITKKEFRFYKNVYSLLTINNKPLEEFNIKCMRNIEILDLNLLKNKNEPKINFAFVINLIENINFFILATNDKNFGTNIINLLNLLKKYKDEFK